jgi:hypothetical protein
MPKVFEAPPGFVLNPDYLVPELRAQRDALLEALKMARPYISTHSMDGYYAEARADAAIKAVEEQK